jgi:hypothetical protein
MPILYVKNRSGDVIHQVILHLDKLNVAEEGTTEDWISYGLYLQHYDTIIGQVTGTIHATDIYELIKIMQSVSRDYLFFEPIEPDFSVVRLRNTEESWLSFVWLINSGYSKDHVYDNNAFGIKVTVTSDDAYNFAHQISMRTNELTNGKRLSGFTAVSID